MDLELEAIPPRPDPPPGPGPRREAEPAAAVEFAEPPVPPIAPTAPAVRVFERAQADYEAHRVQRNTQARQAMAARIASLSRRMAGVSGLLIAASAAMSASAIWLWSPERAVPLGLVVAIGAASVWRCWRWRRRIHTEASAALAAHAAAAGHATAPGARGTPASLAADARHLEMLRQANDRMHGMESLWRETQVTVAGALLGCLAMSLFTWYTIWAWQVQVQLEQVRAIELIPTLAILQSAMLLAGSALAWGEVRAGHGLISCMLAWALVACLLPWPLAAVILPGKGLLGLVFMAMNTMLGLVCGWLIGQWIQVVERNAVQRTA
jgi:hypothetical protein